MRPGKRNPADGNPRDPGFVGSGQGSNGKEDTPQAATARFMALVAVETARGQLDRYALVTDMPALGSVEAADLLDAAADYLTPAGFSDAIKGAPGGAA